MGKTSHRFPGLFARVLDDGLHELCKLNDAISLKKSITVDNALLIQGCASPAMYLMTSYYMDPTFLRGAQSLPRSSTTLVVFKMPQLSAHVISHELYLASLRLCSPEQIS